MKTHPSKIEGIEAQAQTESARALPAHDDSGDSPGAPLSNTAPANCTDGVTTVLRSGIDSLYLSFHGDLDAEIEKDLVRLKLLSQSNAVNDQCQAFIEFGDDRFQVSPKGAGNFRYILSDGRYYIKVSSSDALRMPLCHVRISSELLTRCGEAEPIRELRRIVSQLGEVKRVTVSRIDICCDFVTHRDLGLIPATDWVTRTNFINPHYDNHQYTGTTFGNRNKLRANIYNKSLEAKKSRKAFFDEIWWLEGWNRDQTVWRLEFQFFRGSLADFDINLLYEMKPKLNSLWAYATKEWLRLATPVDDNTRSRWPTDSFWELMQSVQFGDFPVEPMKRRFTHRIPTDNYLYINGIAGITSFMAINNIQDFRKAANEFV